MICHGEHNLKNCALFDQLPRDAPQRRLFDFCLNWNAAGFCKFTNCSQSLPFARFWLIRLERYHRCLACLENHATLNCPNALNKLFLSKKDRIILKNPPEQLPKVEAPKRRVDDRYGSEKRAKYEENDTCNLWNTKGNCRYGSSCRFEHRCTNCDSSSHPLFECPRGRR